MKLRLIPIFLLFASLSYAQVIIYEVQSSNSSTIADEFGDFDDWIEIYNPNDVQIDISGLVLKDNVDTWRIPDNTVIFSNQYLLLWADDEESEGPYHTNFKLSAANGEFLGLFESDSITEIESVNIPPLSEDKTYGRCQNGDWTVLNTPTPLAINDCLVSVPPTILNNTGVMIFPNPTADYVNLKSNESIKEVNLFDLTGKGLRIELEDDKFDMNLIPPGWYMLQIELKNGRIVIKEIIKE